MSDKNNEAKVIREYLVGYCRKYAKDKAIEKLQSLLEKVAKELGVYTFQNLIVEVFPGTKLASFAANGLMMLTFEGYYIANFRKKEAAGSNPYDPLNNEAAYVGYLLYSWARGNVGYVYENLAVDYGPLGRHPTSNWE
jgi:hypothetical protein